MSKPTPQQEAAMAARGNVLVVAGAGTGKTRTLVDRCLGWLLDAQNPGSIDQVLMVTFTEAAAAEMRQRLRARLEEIGAAAPSAHVAEQLALLETAWICTLHSFCFRLVREHFYALGLDPRLVVLPEERAQLLERQALDLVLQNIYSRETPAARAIQQTIQSQGGDSDLAARALVLRLHHYAQTLRDPKAWFAAQIARFERTAPDQWRDWLMAELEERRQAWLAMARGQPAENKAAAHCAAALEGLPRNPGRREFADALQLICMAEPKGKPNWRKPLENLFSEAHFLRSLCPPQGGDPLVEDWNWSAPSMLALLDLTRQFGEAYRAVKAEAGGIDFHDLEQFALRLLVENHQPSAIAAQWRAKLRLIFVDEYQDINSAQEAIIQALGREGAEANRFLVGDLKQSIYRFRLADPRIFLKCQQDWRGQDGGRVMPLSDNFRSHEGILNFVNSVFGTLMRAELGEIEYGEEAWLRFGNRQERAPQMAAGESAPPVELHLRRLGRNQEEEAGGVGISDAGPLSATEQEARLVGRRLAELKGRKLRITGQAEREAGWSDMVILLRSPRRKAESYVKEFARLGVPLAAVGGGFYESLEVRDLLSLLQVLDNPSQDLPLLAVLRSPLVGLTADELAAIRLAQRTGRLWAALLRWHADNPRQERVRAFLERFRAWRRMSRVAGVSQLLGKVVEDTGYGESMPEAGPNVSRLLWLTQQFDSFRGEGLYRFLQFAQAQQENEVEMEPAGRPMREAVRLMSIHQSKGLEFPIVALADLGKRFNLDDLRGRVILDEEFGLCPMVQPPGRRQFYPSLPHWLAQRRQKREIFGEELRLLYVALTRAADRLILFGSARDKTISGKWPEAAARGVDATDILAGRSYMDWLGTWLVRQFGAEALDRGGGNALLTWKIYEEEAAAAQPESVRQIVSQPEDGAIGKSAPTGREVPPCPGLDLELWRQGRALAEWRYPFEAATRRTAKTSVSALRRLMADVDEDQPPSLFAQSSFPRQERKEGQLSAAQIGSAHHAFLEGVSLGNVVGAAQLREEAARLERQGVLSGAETACLDFEALAAFWQSELGARLLGQRECIRRELPFTARFSPEELGGSNGGQEFILVQGVIDLAVVMPEEIWVLDFKTDRFAEEELPAKVNFYRPQLALYAQAIARIYARPVTSAWLHFLALRRTVEVEAQVAVVPGAAPTPAAPSAPGRCSRGQGCPE
jgi:ATP-dependent helicase/nuclease subunit A